ncbi:hypothetical protein BS78_05G053000 [Paspalum vaginatum]|nr:hypothetical protein BS78_05G053000 [Paspalum vaginatum]
MEVFLAVMVIALICMMFPLSSSTSSGSTYGAKIDKYGALQFPVLHRNNPLLPSWIPSSDTPDTTVTEVDSLQENTFFVAISLGTPAVHSLVTIDTASSLSWVQCGEHCDMCCYRQSGKFFNPSKSSSYQSIRCSAEVCRAMHKSSGVFSGCVHEIDACLYRKRYVSGQYSAGLYSGSNAGAIGFGDESYSFFNQVARQTNYRAFSYCFPSSHGSEGFLSIGPYVRDEKLMLTRLISDGHYLKFYAIQQLDMMVNGIQLEVDPGIYGTAVTVVDSGTADSFILSPVFHALDKAVTTGMLAKGYTRENVFYVNSDGGICLIFQPDDAGGTEGVQILGNRALRSVRVVYDIQDMIFGFQAGAC